MFMFFLIRHMASTPTTSAQTGFDPPPIRVGGLRQAATGIVKSWVAIFLEKEAPGACWLAARRLVTQVWAKVAAEGSWTKIHSLA